MKALGYGEAYQYPHDHPDAFVAQEYLPVELRDAEYYQPGPRGVERKIAERLQWWRSHRDTPAGPLREPEGGR
jgi:putative ATPase